MKKQIIYTLVLLFLISGCARNMNDIIQNEPKILGIVEEVRDNSFLLDSDGSKYVVSLDVENSDSYLNVAVGDEVYVYYDGNVQETYPMQINNVYAISLKTPADRSVDENP